MSLQADSPGRPGSAMRLPADARVFLTALLAAGLCASAGWLLGGSTPAITAGVLAGAVTMLVRQPRREIPAVPLGVVSPVSGRITAAGPGHDPWLVRPALHLRVCASFLDVHVLRCPVEGRVMDQWRSRGPAWFRRRCAYWIRTDEGDDVVLVLDLGVAAPAVRVLLNAGRRFGQGQVCGSMFVSGAVDLYLPSGSRLHAAEGIHVTDGSTVLAEFVHTSAVTLSETA